MADESERHYTVTVEKVAANGSGEVRVVLVGDRSIANGFGPAVGEDVNLVLKPKGAWRG